MGQLRASKWATPEYRNHLIVFYPVKALGQLWTMPFFRSGLLRQAVLPPLTETHFSRSPFAPSQLRDFPATMGHSDFRNWLPRAVMHSRRELLRTWTHGTLLCLAQSKMRPIRTSQVPRPIFRRTPPPTTPESPVAAYTHCFTTGTALRPNRRIGDSQGN